MVAVNSGNSTKAHANKNLAFRHVILMYGIVVVMAGFCLFRLFYINMNMNNTPWTDPFPPNTMAYEARSMNVSKSIPTIPTIAYAVTITGCGSDPITEGAAVLKHSIHRSSIYGTGKYNYRMFAIYHPDAIECTKPLAQLGYTLLERDTPVPVDEIEGELLRTHVTTNGCCGEKEFIKLEAYTLIEYPIFVHLDLDVLVLQPLDTLFDWMLQNDDDDGGAPISSQKSNDILMHPNNISLTDLRKPNAFFTMDYNMVSPDVPYKPVQGGFLVARPSMKVYEEYKAIIRQGDYREHGGWGGKVGPFYGSMTFQGIVPYYYNVLHAGESVELNHCIYNTMAINPRTRATVNDVVSGECRTGETDCEDCRSRPIHDIITAHYTICQKPWICLPHDEDMIQHRLCRKLTTEWYRVRSEMEASWGRSPYGPHDYEKDVFHGYCKHSGESGYQPIVQPFGIDVFTPIMLD